MPPKFPAWLQDCLSYRSKARLAQTRNSSTLQHGDRARLCVHPDKTYGSHTKNMIKRQYNAIKASRHSSSEKDTSLTLYFKSPNRLCTHKTSIKFNRSRVAIVRAAMTPYRHEHFWTSSFAVTQIFTSASLY
ncbi:hypothetical protein Anapl_10344 [Anas platyrhynchos]|uniref:Uncharacterized protein n=1 Tax=Anas platyrhynchos TaxID=8839 RepID=R0JIU2_ANAPL|nr:hypothetical protein Anapl_10344 [Anas platyrhynchos]